MKPILSSLVSLLALTWLSSVISLQIPTPLKHRTPTKLAATEEIDYVNSLLWTPSFKNGERDNKFGTLDKVSPSLIFNPRPTQGQHTLQTIWNNASPADYLPPLPIPSLTLFVSPTVLRGPV